MVRLMKEEKYTYNVGESICLFQTVVFFLLCSTFSLPFYENHLKFKCFNKFNDWRRDSRHK